SLSLEETDLRSPDGGRLPPALVVPVRARIGRPSLARVGRTPPQVAIHSQTAPLFPTQSEPRPNPLDPRRGSNRSRLGRLDVFHPFLVRIVVFFVERAVGSLYFALLERYAVVLIADPPPHACFAILGLHGVVGLAEDVLHLVLGHAHFHFLEVLFGEVAAAAAAGRHAQGDQGDQDQPEYPPPLFHLHVGDSLNRGGNVLSHRHPIHSRIGRPS